MTSVIKAANIAKSYGENDVLKDVGLIVEGGEIFALLGANGAGKSTFIDILLGLKSPDRGTVEILGHPAGSRKAGQQIGAMPQDVSFPPHLTPAELIRLVQVHYPDPISHDELVEVFGLEKLVRRQTGGVSGGERRRLALALAFAGAGKAIFLDEPTTGLDTDSRVRFWGKLKHESHQGRTVFLTTHDLSEVEKVATQVCLLNDGHIIFQGTVGEIKRRVGVKRITFTASQVPAHPLIDKLEFADGRHIVFSKNTDELIRDLLGNGFDCSDIDIEPIGLHEAISMVEWEQPDQ